MRERKELTESEQKYKKISVRLAIFFGCLLLVHFLMVSFIYSWADWIAILLFSLLLIVPAYISNASMVITGGGKPIDGGKVLKDGRRLFGDHKTWNGLIKGPLFIGIPISVVVFILFLILWPLIEGIPLAGVNQGIYKIYTDVSYYQYYFIGGPFPIGLLSLAIRIILCSYGAAIGDLIGSFIKRRVNIKSGSFFPIIDELDFALVAILFVSIPGILASGFFLIPDIHIILFLIILTPSVSIIANTIAWALGLKDVPW
jgi:CDP-2,3-bis-(O-geranylgeranyl)-sn-glycerol synthase